MLAKRLEDHAITLKPLNPPSQAPNDRKSAWAYTHYEAHQGEPGDFRIPSQRLSGRWLEEIRSAQALMMYLRKSWSIEAAHIPIDLATSICAQDEE